MIFQAVFLYLLFNMFGSKYIQIEIEILQAGTCPVPPLRSDFPDFGPIPDFFDESGPEMVRFCLKSPDSW